MNIPFNKPVFLEQHRKIVTRLFELNHLSGDGPFTKQCEQILEQRLSKPVRLVTSASHALDMMALLVKAEPGDEVIIPSFTFVSAGNAFALRGAQIRFADCDLYGNILPSEIERLRSPKTKAVVVMHYAGGSADMDQILEICREYSILVLEDAAQAIRASYKDIPLGTMGALGCYSFHETKNVTSGEGGALIIGDSNFLGRSEIIREKGTNRSQFLQGLVDKYTWVEVGSSYVLSELNAGYLYPQLEQLDHIQAKRKQLWEGYFSSLKPHCDLRDVKILEVPAYNTPNYHLFGVLFPTVECRNDFIAYMRSLSIICPFHYVPLHTSPFGIAFYHGEKVRLLGCEKISQCLVRLPMFYNMTEQEQAYVIDSAIGWFKQC